MYLRRILLAGALQAEWQENTHTWTWSNTARTHRPDQGQTTRRSGRAALISEDNTTRDVSTDVLALLKHSSGESHSYRGRQPTRAGNESKSTENVSGRRKGQQVLGPATPVREKMQTQKKNIFFKCLFMMVRFSDAHTRVLTQYQRKMKSGIILWLYASMVTEGTSSSKLVLTFTQTCRVCK